MLKIVTMNVEWNCNWSILLLVQSRFWEREYSHKETTPALENNRRVYRLSKLPLDPLLIQIFGRIDRRVKVKLQPLTLDPFPNLIKVSRIEIVVARSEVKLFKATERNLGQKTGLGAPRVPTFGVLDPKLAKPRESVLLDPAAVLRPVFVIE
jgi:hypothetical protein